MCQGQFNSLNSFFFSKKIKNINKMYGLALYWPFADLKTLVPIQIQMNGKEQALKLSIFMMFHMDLDWLYFNF